MQAASTQTDTLFDLGKFIGYLISKWKWFILFGLSFAVVFAVVSLQMPDKYTSEVLLADADSSSGNMDGLAGQLGGLASFAGININEGKQKKLIALQILQSRQFLIDFVKVNKLEAFLIAVERWDKESDTLIYNDNIFSQDSQEWLAHPERSGSYYPSDLEIYIAMKSILDVDVDKTNKVTRLYLTYYDPVKAQQWLSILVMALNDRIRVDDILEREKQISFLQDELNFEKNAEIRNVFYSLIEEQIKSSTLAKARDEYVFRVIDPAVFPEQKSYPKRALNTVLGGLVGGVLCFIFFSLRFFVKT
jgi:hypothetical protein